MAESVQKIGIDVQANTSQATKGMERLADAVGKVNGAVKENTSVSKENAKETSKTTQEHKKAGNAVHHHANGLKRLAAALKRILIYRAIRGAIKAVTTAMGEGIQRMYEWSKANDQIFMRVMDTYATEVQYLKDALGAAIAPLIEMLMPHLVELVDWFVELINVVNQFFRALAGYDTWLKVEKVAKSYGEEANKAAKAQKALNIQLMDFDQLNNLTTPRSSGRTEEETPPLTGNYVDIDPKIKEFAERFRKMLEPLKEVKKVLGEIWDQLKPIVAEFADGAFSLLAKAISIIADTLKKLKDNGVFDVVLSIIRGINEATLNLISVVLDLFSQVLTKLSQSKAFKTLLEVIGKFTISGIEQTISVFKTLTDSGAIDDLLLGLDDLFNGLSLILGATDEIAKFLTSILNFLLPSLGKIGGIVLSAIGSVLTSVGNILSGICEMLSWIMNGVTDTSFWGAAWKIIYGAFLEPILFVLDGLVKFGEVIADITGQQTEDSKAFFASWKSEFGNFKQSIADGTIFLSEEEKKALDDAKATAAGALDAFNKTASGSEKGVSDALSEMQKGIDGFLKSLNKTTEEVPEAFRRVLAQMDELSRAWARSGKYWGSEYRKGLVEELKKLGNTQIVMQPSQQGNWNKTKVTVQAYADGGFPDMGSMFVAGESGAEMVGSINGRTGVVSGDEISGIASAVYGTGAEEAALLRELIGAVRSQRLTISPSASLGKVVNQSTRLYSGVTG